MRKYTAPEFNIICLGESDILTASSFVTPDGPVDTEGTETPVIGEDNGVFGQAE